MKYVYLVMFDWAVDDASAVEITAYGNYDDAYTKFKEIIADEMNPDLSWVGGLEFDENGDLLTEGYTQDYDDNNSGDSEVYWSISEEGNYTSRHSNVEIRILKIL